MIRSLIARLFQPSFVPFMGGGGLDRSYEIGKSLRLRSAASAWMYRAVGTVMNRTTWTISAWVKFPALDRLSTIASAGDGGSTSISILRLNSTNQLRFYNAGAANSGCDVLATPVLRDTTGWYHVTMVWDTTQPQAADRCQFYINGVRAATTGTMPPLNALSTWGIAYGGNFHRIGVRSDALEYFEGYLADFHFVEGQALTANSFGRIEPSTGQWVPKKYSGTYGGQGFKLNFINGTSLTTLGQDQSGNGNHWTLNNASLTAGPTYDWMDDSPTNNYCYLSAICTSESNVISAGGLEVGGTNSTYNATLGTIAAQSGKYYFEMIVQGGGVAAQDVGLHTSQYSSSQLQSFSSTSRPGAYVVATNSSNSGAVVYNNGVATPVSSTGWTIGDVIGCAVDLDAKSIWFHRNGVWFPASVGGTVGNPALGSFPTTTYATDSPLLPRTACYSNYRSVMNFGQRPFAYSIPSGFKTLCSKNLQSENVISAGSYVGNAAANGPFVWCNGTPESLQINGNPVSWGVNVDRVAGGFKIRTSGAGFNASGNNSWVATYLTPSRKSAFRNQRAKVN